MMQLIPNYIEKLDDKICVVGIHNILKESHTKSGLSCRQAGNLLSLSRDYYQKHLTIKPQCSVKFLKDFEKNIDTNIFNKIYEKEELIFTAKKKHIRLPKEVDPDLAYFIGYLQGDGCLSSDGKYVLFTDEYKEQLEKINDISEGLFGVRGIFLQKESRISHMPVDNLQIGSVVLNSFMNMVFKINKGEKNSLSIPALIKQDEQLLRHYLSGLFDADGTLPKEPKKAKQLFIDITMKDKGLIEEIKESLQTSGIETLKTYERHAKYPNSDVISRTYELRIRRKAMLLKFLQEISFYHPNKAIRAGKMLKLLS